MIENLSDLFDIKDWRSCYQFTGVDFQYIDCSCAVLFCAIDATALQANTSVVL